MKKVYTLGEVFRLGLLKNHAGEPYKNKATVLKIIRTLKHTKRATPWGEAYAVTPAEIARHNKKIRFR